MLIRNISPLGLPPVLRIDAETPEDGATLKYFFMKQNQNQKIDSLKVVTSLNGVKSIDFGYLGWAGLMQKQQPEPLSFWQRLLFAVNFIFSKNQQ